MFTEAIISHRTTFSYCIPYLFLSKLSLSLPRSHFFHWAHSSFPPEHWDQLSCKLTLLFLPGIFLLQLQLSRGVRAFGKFLLAAPGWSRCFRGGSPASAEAAGHHFCPGSQVRSSELQSGVLSAIVLFRSQWGILGTKTFPATAVSLASVSFAIIARLQFRDKKEKVPTP